MLLLVACGGDTEPLPDIEATVEQIAYVKAVQPIVHSMERSLQGVEDAYITLNMETTRFSNDELSEDYMRRLIADLAVIFIREGVILEGIVEQLTAISPPTEAERYHELLLEYAGLRRDVARLTGTVFSNPLSEDSLKAVDEADEISVRANLKNKEVVIEGLRLGWTVIDFP